MHNEFSGYISAGGKGSRLLPITETIPKPLVKINKMSLIELWMKQFHENHVEDLFISVHHMKEKVINHVNNLNEKYNFNIKFLEETAPLGTAGSVFTVFNKFKNVENLIIVMADVVCNDVIESMVSKYKKSSDSLLFTSRSVEIQVPFGIVDLQNDKNIIIEKPINKYNINSGMYILNKSLKKYVPKDTVLDMPDFINSIFRTENISNLNIDNLKWFDVGNPEDLHKVRNLF